MLGKLMDDETIARLREEELKFRARPLHYDDPKPNPPTLFRSQMSAYSEPVRNFGLNGPHLPLVEQVLGQNLAWIYTQFVTKFPDANLGKSEFPWHQDNGYSKVLPENNMTIWIPLDDVNEENGCVLAGRLRSLSGARSATSAVWCAVIWSQAGSIPPQATEKIERDSFAIFELQRQAFANFDDEARLDLARELDLDEADVSAVQARSACGTGFGYAREEDR